MFAAGTPSLIGATASTAPAIPRAMRGGRRSWLRRLLDGKPHDPTPRPGARTGSFELVRPLSHGGMGEVWLARHRRTRRSAAVKLLHTDARPGTASWTTAALRLQREAAIMASLSPHHVASVYEAGTCKDGSPYYAMELIDGTDLHELIVDDGPQAPARVARLIAQLGRALAEAHARGIVHRDIKPANVMLRGDELKLIDFGVARDGARSPALTGEGHVIGTALYMAPEAVLSTAPLGPAADIYSVGCVAHFLLRGRAPFSGSNVPEVLYKHVHELPPPLPPSVPAPLADAIERCLDKDPAKRPTAQQLAALADGYERSETAKMRSNGMSALR